MDDLISRKAAIDALGKDPGFKVKLFGKSYDEGRSDQWFKDVHVLTALPSAQPEQRWIPVTERLPEKPCYCLTSNEYSNVCEDFYWGEDSFEKANKYHCEVLAWMPFPEPYKGGETE